MVSLDAKTIAHLRVRVRTTEYCDHESTEAPSVHCPVAGASVSLGHCLDCPQLVDYLAGDPGGPTLCCEVPSQLLAPTLCSLALDPMVPVSQVMSTQVTCVDVGLSLDELAHLFKRDRIHAAPVVDDDGSVVGMVCQSDLIRGRRDPSGRGLEDELHYPPDCVGVTVRDVMTSQVLKLQEGAPLADALALLSRERIHRIPIVDDQDEVVGLLSTSDVVRWLAGEPAGAPHATSERASNGPR